MGSERTQTEPDRREGKLDRGSLTSMMADNPQWHEIFITKSLEQITYSFHSKILVHYFLMLHNFSPFELVENMELLFLPFILIFKLSYKLERNK